MKVKDFLHVLRHADPDTNVVFLCDEKTYDVSRVSFLCHEIIALDLIAEGEADHDKH